MAENLWNAPGIPHKGWACIGVRDLREDEGFDETEYATCQMCGKEGIRFVHVMEHPEIEGTFEVGCICAEKMSDEYKDAKRRENKLKNRSLQQRKLRYRLIEQPWKISKNNVNNEYIKPDNYHLLVFFKYNHWHYKIESPSGKQTFSDQHYPSKDAAKLALVNVFLKETKRVFSWEL